MKSFGEAGKKPFLVDNRTENDEKVEKRKITHLLLSLRETVLSLS